MFNERQQIAPSVLRNLPIVVVTEFYRLHFYRIDITYLRNIILTASEIYFT